MARRRCTLLVDDLTGLKRQPNWVSVKVPGRSQTQHLIDFNSQNNGIIIPVQGSVSSHDDLQRAVDKITLEAGHIDLLVNNAGMTTMDSSPNARPVPNADSTAAEMRDYYFNYRPAALWNETLETNVASVFTTSMAFLELLEAGNKKRAKDLPTSQIITIGSVGGMNRFTPSFIYNASKAGVHHLMKNLGSAFVPFDIRTNVVAPGCEFGLHEIEADTDMISDRVPF